MSTDTDDHLGDLGPVEILYTDLDCTLLGPGGALLRDADGRPTARAAAALADAAAAGITVVPVSGRHSPQLRDNVKLLGLSDFIAEAGACVSRAGVLTHAWGACPRDLADNPHDALVAAGAVDALLDAFAGDLRPFEPWHRGREGGQLFHGVVDVDEAATVLAKAGCDWAQLIDNGPADGWPGRAVRAYHLLPHGVGKAAAVDDDLAVRDVPARAAAAVGDSLEDLTLAQVVGTYFIVANGQGESGGNVFRMPGRMGDGFADAVERCLRTRR